MALQKPGILKTVLKRPYKNSDRGIGQRIYRRLFFISYITGKLILRTSHRVIQSVGYLAALSRSGCNSLFGSLTGQIKRLSRSRAATGGLSVSRLMEGFSERAAAFLRSSAGAFHSGGAGYGMKETARLARDAGRNAFKRYRGALNYIAPAVGIFALAFTIYFWTHASFAVSVSYNGKFLGEVRSVGVYNDAVNKIEDSVAQASGGNFKLDRQTTYKMVLAKKSDILDADQLYNNIVMSSGNGVKNGYGLYIDNRLVGSSTASGKMEAMLNSVLNGYKEQAGVQDVSFVQDVNIKAGVFPDAVFKTDHELQDELTGTGNNTMSAENIDVKPDSMFRISLDPLYAMNLTSGVNSENVVVADDRVPTLSVKVVKNEVESQPLPFSVQQIQSDKLKSGQTKVVTPGKNGVQQVVSAVTYIDGVAASQQVISSTIVTQPVTQQVMVGTKDAKASSGGKGSDSAAVPAPNVKTSGNLIGYAEGALGVPYVMGGSSFSGFDCSGFTQYVFSKYGVSLEHSAAEQSTHGSPVSRGALQSGDLVFFDTNGGHNNITHVGIYIGSGQFIDASSAHPHAVTIDNINSAYYSSKFMTARRVLH